MNRPGPPMSHAGPVHRKHGLDPALPAVLVLDVPVLVAWPLHTGAPAGAVTDPTDVSPSGV